MSEPVPDRRTARYEAMRIMAEAEVWQEASKELVRVLGESFVWDAVALWIVHELGVPFEHIAKEMKELKNPDYLQINPNGKVPTLVDGDFKLFESMAINLYLAAKHGKDGFFPASLEDQAVCHQWSFWGMTEVERPLLTILIDMFMTAPDKRKPEAVAEAQKALPKPFNVLNGALQDREYLLGSKFTVADLNLASICSWAKDSRARRPGGRNGLRFIAGSAPLRGALFLFGPRASRPPLDHERAKGLRSGRP